ncbi:hypothetical protein [Romboutsia lituseburensis]|uniref:hypothetical protein n=1 Tax=Romboutsia lituseburensis TaxID=1537 RepID=UPI00215B3617|nr:hypothetical protein [Romboutsia lituseburensis]MCR8746977.1 hypothetical protein [Romboutsia lituseburensis]
MKKTTKYILILFLLILLGSLTYSFNLLKPKALLNKNEKTTTSINFLDICVDKNKRQITNPIEIESFRVKKEIYNKLKHIKLIKSFDKSINSYIYLIDIINYANQSIPVSHIKCSEKLFSTNKYGYHLINSKDIYEEIINLIEDSV